MISDLIPAIFHDATGLLIIAGIAAFLIGAGVAVMVMLAHSFAKPQSQAAIMLGAELW